MQLWGGVPAKIIKYRFKEEIIARLLELKWWNLSLDLLEDVPFNDIEKAIELIEFRKHNNLKFLKPNKIKLTSKLKILE